MEKYQGTEYLKYVVETAKKKPVESAGRSSFRSANLELAKMELAKRGIANEPIVYTNIDGALEWIDKRNDCADFIIPCLVRMLHEHRGTRLSEDYAQKIEKSLLGFKYWLDEPGEVHACFFTENHQILFHSAEYLVGQLFPDKIFNNGENGEWHRQHAIKYIRRWQDWRIRFGFSEWLCQGYYAEDMLALLGLAHYAAEDDILTNARLIIDQLLFDMAVNCFYGHLPTTHGRVYANILDPDTEGVSAIMHVMWGVGTLADVSDIAILLCSYDYKCTDAIAKVGTDRPDVLINRERMSIDVAEGKYYGADPADFDNIMLYWGIQAYSDRLTVENSTKVFPYYNWMNNRIFAYRERYKLCDEAGVPAPEGTPDFTAMTKVNIYTYKTPDYILSCAQDFRPGRMGYQQHPWTASLGGKALVFTNNPAAENFTNRPNKVAGNLVLPRAAAHNNVVLSVFRVMPDFVDFLYTQCYFPQGEFDEVVEDGKWLFGRKDNAYVAVYSLNDARWEAPSPEYLRFSGASDLKDVKPYIYMTPGHANVWAVELGSKAQNGSFEDFRAAFKDAKIVGDTHNFVYTSPSQGEMKFGWTCPLVVNGEEIALGDYPRYDNPYCQAEFNTKVLEINAGGSHTVLDAEKGVLIDE